jgi:hypothetical protein
MREVPSATAARHAAVRKRSVSGPKSRSNARSGGGGDRDDATACECESDSEYNANAPDKIGSNDEDDNDDKGSDVNDDVDDDATATDAADDATDGNGMDDDATADAKTRRGRGGPTVVVFAVCVTSAPIASRSKSIAKRASLCAHSRPTLVTRMPQRGVRVAGSSAPMASA